MTTQPEQIFENSLVTQLTGLGYSPVVIKDEKALVANLKTQLEKHNKISLSATEFKALCSMFRSRNNK